MARNNVVLIGMPGAGKSTVGVVLAKRLGFGFVDTDILIQAKEHRKLQDIIDKEGLAAFCQIEEQVLLELEVEMTVIATGGSVIYSEAGMRALKETGLVVFLDVPLPELEKRLLDMDCRGMVIDPGETLTDLFRRRRPLYRRWADRTAEGLQGKVEDVAAHLAELVRNFRGAEMP